MIKWHYYTPNSPVNLNSASRRGSIGCGCQGLFTYLITATYIIETGTNTSHSCFYYAHISNPLLNLRLS